MKASLRSIRLASVNPLASAVLALMVLARPAAAQLEVDRLEVFMRGPTGTINGTFAVRNVSDTARTVRVGTEDWIRTLDGVTQSDSVGKMPGSCGKALSIFPTSFRLEPRQSQPVRVIYAGTPRTTSCWAIAWVDAAPLATPNRTGASISVNLIQGVKIYVEPGTARPMLELKDLGNLPHRPAPNAPPSDTLGRDITVLVTNPGVIQSRVKGRVEYRTAADSVISTVKIDEFPILPQATRMVRSRMPSLRPGSYVVLIFLDYGGADIVAGQIQLDVK